MEQKTQIKFIIFVTKLCLGKEFCIIFPLYSRLSYTKKISNYGIPSVKCLDTNSQYCYLDHKLTIVFMKPGVYVLLCITNCNRLKFYMTCHSFVGSATIKAKFGSGNKAVGGCIVEDGKLEKNCAISVTRK